MAVQEMHTIQKVDREVDGGADGLLSAHAHKKKRIGVEGRAMCRVQPLYIKNWGKKNGGKEL